MAVYSLLSEGHFLKFDVPSASNRTANPASVLQDMQGRCKRIQRTVKERKWGDLSPNATIFHCQMKQESLIAGFPTANGR